MHNKGFGSHIKKLRQIKGLNITETAKLSGVSQPYLSQVERGERKAPSYKIIQKLATALDSDYYDLLVEAGHINEDEAKKSKAKLSEAQHVFSDSFLHAFNLIYILEDDRPLFYNGYELTEKDRQRILNVLKELFPEYQDKKE